MSSREWTLTAASLLGFLALILWLLNMEHASHSPVRWTVCLLLPVLIAVYGVRKRSLDFSGGMLAVLVGFLLTAASACFCASLLAFFVTSSRLTKWRGEEKSKLDAEYKEGGQRNWAQVLCNGGVASVAALLYLHSAGMGERPLVWSAVDLPSLYAGACLGAISCCCGDTWASEVGAVLGKSPQLITTWITVPRGTNGGVSGIGVFCSLGGGLIVGLTYYTTLLLFLDDMTVVMHSQLPVLAIGGLSGLIGSLIDSLLGATLQFSGYSKELGKVVNAPGPNVKHISGVPALDNHTVNLLSSLLTAVIVVAGLWCVQVSS